MKISVRKAAPDVFALTFDSQEVVLDGGDVKRLLAEIARILSPGSAAMGSPSANIEDFLRNLRRANDVGVQTLIRQAAHEDVLVLLKATESDAPAAACLSRNMSERLRKICAEDLAYKYREPLTPEQAIPALSRLSEIARELEGTGVLVYQDVKVRPKGASAAPGANGA